MFTVEITGPAGVDRARLVRVLASLLNNPEDWEGPPPDVRQIIVYDEDGKVALRGFRP